MKSDQFFNIYQTLCKEWEAFLLSNGIKLMTHPGIRILSVCYYISRHPGCSLNEVAREFGITAGTASNLVDSLCRRGFLERIQSETDRRSICLTTTPRLNAFLERVKEL